MAGPYTIPDVSYGGDTPDPVEWANGVVKPTLLDLYAERAGAVFLEVSNSTQPTITANSFETVPVGNVITNIGGGSFNTGTYIYTIPRDGLYDCQATVRIADSVVTRSLGVGIGVLNADGAHFLWSQMGGVNRDARQYRRLTRFTTGDLVRLYIYSDSQGFPLNAANLVIMRVGE